MISLKRQQGSLFAVFIVIILLAIAGYFAYTQLQKPTQPTESKENQGGQVVPADDPVKETELNNPFVNLEENNEQEEAAEDANKPEDDSQEKPEDSETSESDNQTEEEQPTSESDESDSQTEEEQSSTETQTETETQTDEEETPFSDSEEQASEVILPAKVLYNDLFPTNKVIALTVQIDNTLEAAVEVWDGIVRVSDEEGTLLAELNFLESNILKYNLFKYRYSIEPGEKKFWGLGIYESQTPELYETLLDLQPQQLDVEFILTEVSYQDGTTETF